MLTIYSTFSETQEGNNINLVSRMCKQATSKKSQWQKQLAAWSVTQSSSATLRHLSSAYRFSISNRLFYGAGYSEGLSFLVLKMFGSHFLLCPACSIRTKYSQQSRQRHFLAKWLTFATKNVNFIWSFFSARYFIWNRLVLLGADIIIEKNLCY